MQKAANGQVATEKSSPKKSSTKSETASKKSDENSKPKERKQDDNKTSNNKKLQDSKVGKENKVEQAKNKKNLKNSLQEKPVDYDEGVYYFFQSILIQSQQLIKFTISK